MSRFSLMSSPIFLVLLSRTGIHVGCLVLASFAYSIDTLLFNPCIDTELICLKKIWLINNGTVPGANVSCGNTGLESSSLSLRHFRFSWGIDIKKGNNYEMVIGRLFGTYDSCFLVTFLVKTGMPGSHLAFNI